MSSRFASTLFVAGAFLASPTFAAPQKSKLPPDAQALLESLPGEAVSLELVLGRAMVASDSFRALRSEIIRVPVARLQAGAPLDYRLNVSGTIFDDETEVSNPFQPNRTRVEQFSLGVSKYFSTGTAASVTLTTGSTNLLFAPSQANPAGTTIEYLETTALFQLSQNLWKDVLGIGTRAGIEAGEAASEATLAGFTSSIEQWALDLTGLFHQAWLSQAGTRTAYDRVSVQERLLRITRIKARRGTAEEPHVLQAESGLAQARIAASQAHEGLNVIWRQLVTALKLPESWLKIDPLLVPIRLDQPVAEAVAACGTEENLRPAPESSASTVAALKSAEAAAKLLKQAEWSAKPDLKAILSLEANGIEDPGRFGPSFSETIGINHPAWTAGVQLEMPFGFSIEEAQVRTARADFERADAQASSAVSDLKVGWINTCMELFRLRSNVRMQEETVENQRRRTRLEERRFELGRASLQEVIQAQNDLNQAEFAWYQARSELLGTSWNVWRVTGKLETFVKDLIRNPPRLKGEQTAPALPAEALEALETTSTNESASSKGGRA